MLLRRSGIAHGLLSIRAPAIPSVAPLVTEDKCFSSEFPYPLSRRTYPWTLEASILGRNFSITRILCAPSDPLSYLKAVLVVLRVHLSPFFWVALLIAMAGSPESIASGIDRSPFDGSL